MLFQFNFLIFHSKGGEVLGTNTTTNVTEYFDTETRLFIPGPVLPYPLGINQHCMAWKDDDSILIIGGHYLDTSTNEFLDSLMVYEFNTRTQTFSSLPSIPSRTVLGGCIVKDTTQNGRELIVLPGEL